MACWLLSQLSTLVGPVAQAVHVCNPAERCMKAWALADRQCVDDEFAGHCIVSVAAQPASPAM